MGDRFLLDFVRGNRASSATIAVTVGVSSLLLALLSCVLYNFWADAAAQAASEGIDWQARLGGELLVTTVLYAVVLVLACITLVLIIRNAFAASMQSRMHQLGILATIGATPRQIRTMLLQEALFLSALPAVIGIALGTLAAGAFVTFVIGMSQQMELTAGADAFCYHPVLLLVTVLLVFLTVLVSAGLPARKLAKTNPLAAVSGASEAMTHIKQKRGSFARIFGIEGELAEGSMRQRRAALRSASVSIGLSFLVMGMFLSFMTVSQLSVEQTYYERFGIAWDVVVDVPDATESELEQVANTLAPQIETSAVDTSDKGMRLYVVAHEGEQIAVQQALEEALNASGHPELFVVDMAVEREKADAIWVGYALVVGGFCSILALIGIAGVFTQAIGFVYQRRREFARLRSIGMTPAGVLKMLSVEGLMTTVRPFVIILPIVIVCALCLGFLGRQPAGVLLANFPYDIFLSYLLIIVLLVVVAYAIGAHRVNHCNLPEALKNDTLV